MFLNELASSVATPLREVPFPDGAAIVKEKKSEPDADSHALGAMVKMGSGYDSRVGDWAFVYVDENGIVSAGKEQTNSCVSCHATTPKTDFVFGSYFK